MTFSLAMGAEYLSYLKSIATFALTFFGYMYYFSLSQRVQCVLCLDFKEGFLSYIFCSDFKEFFFIDLCLDFKDFYFLNFDNF